MKNQHYSDTPSFTPCEVDIQTVTRHKSYTHSFKEGRNKHGLLYTAKRSIRYDVQGDEKMSITACEGDLVFMPKSCIYSCTYLDDYTTVKIVQFDISSGALPDYLAHPTKIDLPDAAERIRPFFTRIENNLSSHPFYYLSCLYALLWHIDECCFGIPHKYGRLRPAIEELTDRCEKNLKISYYANLCDMSEVNFRRLFKEYTGRSPIEYRNDIRLSRARAMLQSKEFNVAETSEICGFSNLSFFIRLYKKRFGHTPKKA